MLELKSKHTPILQNLTILNETRQELTHLEDNYWSYYALITQEREQSNLENLYLNKQLTYNNQFLKNIQNIYILNDVFHIWYYGHFGTINGLKLGRLPIIPTDWAEINSACGMLALLMTNMARELHYEFNNWVIYPMGNMSKIEYIKDHTQYELYTDRDSLYHILMAYRYDRAMLGILECISQLIQYISRLDSSFFLSLSDFWR